jgi:nitrite reductase/ring-hydroxylating ferredoxin subunit
MPDVQQSEPHEVPANALPQVGKLVAVTLAGRDLVLANVEGVIFALDALCTHEECPLADGELDEHFVVCECHGGTFDVRTGEPVEGPVHVPLLTHDIVWEEATVFVRLARQASS